MEYKVGLRLISNALKGVIIQDKDLVTNYIIIEWEKPDLIGVVQYTELMLDEAFLEGIIKIDKEYYRNQKLEQLGI